jgi:hypothetical protein
MSGMTAQELEDLVYSTLDSFRGPARFPTQARAGIRDKGKTVWNWAPLTSLIRKLGFFDSENGEQFGCGSLGDPQTSKLPLFRLSELPLPQEVRWLKTACSRAAFFKAALRRKMSWEHVTIC